MFNISFARPHCKDHMVQLHHDYQKNQAMGAEVRVVLPNGLKTIGEYRRSTDGCPLSVIERQRLTRGGTVFQIKRFFSLGTPTVFVVNRAGQIRYAYYATSMLDEPDNSVPRSVLAELAG